LAERMYGNITHCTTMRVAGTSSALPDRSEKRANPLRKRFSCSSGLT